MEPVLLPVGFTRASATVATLLEPLGHPLAWWLAALVMLAAAVLLSRRRAGLATALAVVASLAFAVACDGLVDDAYIQFRYAANLAAGAGPVFNPGERIEGASGGVWIGALALGSRLTGLEAGIVGRALSLLLAPLATLLAALPGRRLAGERAGALAAAIWAALPTPALYAATGLETAAFAAALWLVAAGAVAERAGSAAFGGALVALLRPEGAVLAALALPAWRRLGRAGRAAVIAALLAGAAIAGARLAYYGAPLPRSVLVKGFAAAAPAAFGTAYLGRALLEWWPLLLAAPAALRPRRALPALLAALGWTAVVTLRGGDWMPGSRYLLPLLVVLVVAAACHAGKLRAAPVVILIAWGAAQTVPLHEPRPPIVGALARAMAEHRVQSRWWEALGRWLGGSAPPGTTLATGPAGALPYASGLPTFDLYGLCSPVSSAGSGQVGPRLWGLPEATAAGSTLLYPGRPLPQVGDDAAVLAAAELQLRDAPAVRERYRPRLVRHWPEYPLDVVVDVVWVRLPDR
jgi:hypothetical protein